MGPVEAPIIVRLTGPDGQVDVNFSYVTHFECPRASERPEARGTELHLATGATVSVIATPDEVRRAVARAWEATRLLTGNWFADESGTDEPSVWRVCQIAYLDDGARA